MSDTDLGRLVKERWAEVLILIVVLGMGKLLWDMNREVGGLAAGQSNTSARLDRVDSGIARIGVGLERLTTSLAVLGERVSHLVSNSVAHDGPKYTAARAIEWQQFRSILQSGELSQKTLAIRGVDGKTYVFRWPLIVDIPMFTNATVYASFADPVANTAISGQLSTDRESIQINVTANDPDAFAKRLEDGIPATAAINYYEPTPLTEYQDESYPATGPTNGTKIFPDLGPDSN